MILRLYANTFVSVNKILWLEVKNKKKEIIRIIPRFLTWATRCIEMPFDEIVTISENLFWLFQKFWKEKKEEFTNLALPIEE